MITEHKAYNEHCCNVKSCTCKCIKDVESRVAKFTLNLSLPTLLSVPSVWLFVSNIVTWHHHGNNLFMPNPDGTIHCAFDTVPNFILCLSGLRFTRLTYAPRPVIGRYRWLLCNYVHVRRKSSTFTTNL